MGDWLKRKAASGWLCVSLLMLGSAVANGIFASLLSPDERCFAITVSAVASSIVGAMASFFYAASLFTADAAKRRGEIPA